MQKKTSARLQSGPGCVFVYSGFRTSSTWFWSILRQNPKLLCYYEVFNDGLATVSQETVAALRPTDWRSRHPDHAPYLLEYIPLLRSVPGIAGFPAQKGFGNRYVGAHGLDGPLDEDVRSYLTSLVEAAHAKERIAVLTCTRMLALSAGIRKSFPGFHILLIRNLFKQWNSYSGQHRTGNDWFLMSLFETIKLGDRVPFINYLGSFFSKDQKENFHTWLSRNNYDNIFCYFVSLHVFLYVHTRRHCDLLIDVNALAADKDYRTGIEGEIKQRLGVEVDFSSAKDSIDYPEYLVRDHETCRLTIEGTVSHAYDLLKATPEERVFADRLIEDLWLEHDRFTYYTVSATEALAAHEQLRREGELQRLHIAELDAAYAQQLESITNLNAHQAHLKAELERERSLIAQQAQRITEIDASHTQAHDALTALRAEYAKKTEALKLQHALVTQHALRIGEIDAAYKQVRDALTGCEQESMEAKLNFQREVDRLKAELADTRAKSGRQKAEYDEAVRSFEEQVSDILNCMKA